MAVTELEAFYSGDSEVLKKFNRVLFALLKVDKLLTPTLKDGLSSPLKVYLDFIQTRRDLAQDCEQISDLVKKCNLIDDFFDYYNKDAIVNFFKNKQPFRIDKYIKVINGFILKLVMNEDNLSLNRKYIKQVFAGD